MHLENMPLSSIEDVSREELSEDRLNTLLNGYSPFDEVLYSSGEPIALDLPGPPYRIIAGRHRIYLARQRGYTSVPAQCLWDKPQPEISDRSSAPMIQDTTYEDITREGKDAFRMIFLVAIGIMVSVFVCGLIVVFAVFEIGFTIY